jgi:hypothetical protein
VKRQNVIHVIANCRDCEWSCEDIETAQDKAKRHAKKLKHYVSVEVGLAFTYDHRIQSHERRLAQEAGDE